MSTRQPKTGKKTGVMVSPRSGAVVATGAHAGNTGGKPGRSGRPPSAVRELCRLRFEERIPVLVAIADGEPLQKIALLDGSGMTVEAKVSASPADRIRAIDTLGKYGGIEKLAVETTGSTGGLSEMSDEELLRAMAIRGARLEASMSLQLTLRSAASESAANPQ